MDAAGLVPITHSAFDFSSGDRVYPTLRALSPRGLPIPRGVRISGRTRSISHRAKPHVGGKLVGEPATLATRLAFGLAVSENGAGAQAPDAAGCEGGR